MSIGFIIQARLGSTRLPEKVIKPFYNSSNILEIIIDNIKSKFSSHKIIIATSNNVIDAPIETIANKLNLPCYRGSEKNVLDRFIKAAQRYELETIFRVCADNPFIDIESFLQLEQKHFENSFDYIGFSLNGTPSIKTHFGFWGELVQLKTLQYVSERTSDSLYLEHVTNFIYANPDLFKLGWIEIDPTISKRNDIRLTVDTADDFNTLKELYSSLIEAKLPFSPGQIIQHIEKYPKLKESMQKEILRNTK